MNVSQIEFTKTGHQSATCRVISDTGQITLNCTSLLPSGSRPAHHHVAWLQDLMRQINRMPDLRNNSRKLEEAILESLSKV